MVSRHFLIRGRVQGVGFRYFTFRVALHCGIRGWVRNLDNGDVEIRAEGIGEEMREFEARLRSGPPMSSVEDVVIRDREVENFKKFTIEH